MQQQLKSNCLAPIITKSDARGKTLQLIHIEKCVSALPYTASAQWNSLLNFQFYSLFRSEISRLAQPFSHVLRLLGKSKPTLGETCMHEFCALECARAMTKSENNSHESEQSASGGAKVTRMTHLEVQNDGPDETQDELGIPVDNVLCSDVHQLYLQINFGTCQHTFFISKKL